MDLDDLDGTSQAPSRPRKFAPGRAGKPKTKQEQAAAKPEPPPPQQPDAPVPIRKENEAEEKPKVEQPAVSNGSAVKVEIESKMENKREGIQSEPMDEDRHELQQQQPAEEVDVEEEDAVLREIDVFFNPSIDAETKLYVLQYPLRPSWRPYDLDERCAEVRVKPETAELEVDLSMDVNSKNYDKEMGSMLRMTKQTLSTTWRPSHVTDYAVGVLIGDKLHLNPVHAVIQLRPSMEYLTSSKKKHNLAANEPKEESAGPSKKQNKGIGSSAEQQASNEESWIPLKYRGLQSDYSSRYLHRMMAKDISSIDFSMSPADYINSLCPGGGSKSFKSEGPSRRSLLSLPLEDRIKKLLSEGPPFRRFSVLKHYCPDDSDEDVLRVLQQCAFLVQGLWIIRTSLLKLEQGLPFARNYVLLLFSKDTIIKSSQVDAAGRARDRVKEVLNTLAVERPLLNDWKFKDPIDASFIKCYPEIVRKQEEVWKAVEESVMAGIRNTRGKVDSRKNLRTKPDIAVKAEKTMNPDKAGTSNVAVTHVRSTMSEETGKALTKALKKVFQTHKACSLRLICQGLQDLAVSKANNPRVDPSAEVVAAYAAKGPSEELREVISQVAANIHGFYVLKSSPDHPEYDSLRKVVIDLFCGMGPDAKLKKAEVFEAGKTVLHREITANEYNKVMTDLCESKGSAWVLRKSA